MIEPIQAVIDELLLDMDNPRLGSVSSQIAAIEALVMQNDKHFLKMMQSIKENGLDPGDSLYTIDADQEDMYVVLDGNRRLAALKVLCSPYLLDNINVPGVDRKPLQNASVDFDRTQVEPISCTLFPDREMAHEWIMRRHTGAANGEGRIQWGSLETKRFVGDHSTLDILDFVKRNGDYADDEWKSIEAEIWGKSTNLERLLESSAGRKHLGLSIETLNKEKIPQLASDPKWALKVFKKLIEDVRGDVINSRLLNKASDINNYFASLPKSLQPQGGTVSPKPLRDIYLEPLVAPPSLPLIRQTRTRRRPRKGLAPRTNVFKQPKSTKAQDLLREASDIDADKYKYSAALLLRTFLELTLNEYMEANSLPKTKNQNRSHEASAAEKARRVSEDIQNKEIFSSADLRGFQKHMIQSSSITSIQSLNDIVHGKYHTPTTDALRAAWDSCVPVFVATYGKS